MSAGFPLGEALSAERRIPLEKKGGPLSHLFVLLWENFPV